MQITIDTTQELTELDRAVLGVLTGIPVDTTIATPVAAAAAPAAKKAAAKKAPAKAVEPEPEADDDEDLVGGSEPTMKDAVALATKLVSEKKTAVVKAALAVVGAKKVSELADEDVAAFIDAVDENDV